MPAHALRPEPGWEVLDACAAPGNKTTHVAGGVLQASMLPVYHIHLPTSTMTGALCYTVHLMASCRVLSRTETPWGEPVYVSPTII